MNTFLSTLDLLAALKAAIVPMQTNGEASSFTANTATIVRINAITIIALNHDCSAAIASGATESGFSIPNPP